jgi:hypothetical protein
MRPTQPTKKRHHFNPEAYLKSFCGPNGTLYAYFKDNPRNPTTPTPKNAGVRRYYYSQPLPDGGRDHNTLEDFFSKLETKWTPLVERMQRREDVNDALPELRTFIALQRARVPAARDASERMAAARVKAIMHELNAKGKLPPAPPNHPDILARVEFAIDPHLSIQLMPTFMDAMLQVLDRLGLVLLHNTTDVPFITSDNPIVYFDPSADEESLRPYALGREGGAIALLFPITPKVMLFGDSRLRDPFRRYGMQHGDLDDLEKVAMMNRYICRFGYEAVYADRDGFEDLVAQYAHESPIAKSTIIDEGTGMRVEHESVFGKRERKPKWHSGLGNN